MRNLPLKQLTQNTCVSGKEDRKGDWFQKPWETNQTK